MSPQTLPGDVLTPGALAFALIGVSLSIVTGLVFGYQRLRADREHGWSRSSGLILAGGAVAWSIVLVVLLVRPEDGGTWVMGAFALSWTITCGLVIRSTDRMTARLRFPRVRILLDGLLSAVAVTTFLWYSVLGPLLLLSGPARRTLTAVVLMLVWTASLVLLFGLSFVFTRLRLYNAAAVGAAGVGVTLITMAWPVGPLTSGDAMIYGVGGMIVAASRVIVPLIAARAPGLVADDLLGDELPHRGALTSGIGLGHDADLPGLPSPLELNPSTAASLLSAVLLITTLALWPMPVPQEVPLALVVALALVFMTRERLVTSIREHLTRRLRRQALTDPLTGLTNRRGLSERLTRIDGREPWVVVTVDVDGFKRVNDVLGFDVADDLLAAVGREIAVHAPPPALACRLGGDEFAVIQPGDLGAGLAMGQRLRRDLNDVMRRHARGIAVTASVGVGRLAERSHRVAHAHDPLSSLNESAAALAAAKSRAGDAVVVYAGSVAVARNRRRRVEARLRAMVNQRRVGLAALPVVDLASGRIVALEALARWEDRLLGPVSPEEFIPIAERAQLMVPLGEQILRRAIDEAAELSHRSGHHSFSLSFNASLVQLRRPDFVDTVQDLLDTAQFPASRLTMDVPESTLLSEDDAVSGTLIKLADLGVKIAIDDFGTGYLALSCLQWLPVHALKVDRALTGAPEDRKSRAVVETVIDIAHTIDLPVVMEGVASAELAGLWRSAGADAGQGFALVPPGPWESMLPLLARDARDAVPRPSDQEEPDRPPGAQV